MLVLTRRVGESIVIGNDVVVTVVEARGDQIRLGIDAPRHVQVHREEVFRQVEQDNAAAVASAGRASALLGTRGPDLRRGGQSAPSKPAGGGDPDPGP